MIYIRDKRGFTMVELVIVIAIMGVVFTAASSFLLTNLKIFHRADDQIDAQYNAQMAMNEIVDNIMGSEGIVSIKPDPREDIVGTLNITEIVFKVDDEYIKYDYNKEKKVLSRGKGSDIDSIDIDPYVSNINDFSVELILDDGVTDYDKSIGIIINIETLIKDSNIKLTNQVYFRNASN